MSNETKQELTEFRVVGVREGEDSLWTGPTRLNRGDVEADLVDWKPPYTNVRIQQRTVVTTPWEDVANA